MKHTARIAMGAFVIGIGVAGIALAGKKSAGTVTIDFTKLSASGGLGGARNSADIFQYIGCSMKSTSNTPPNAPVTGICAAMDALGNSVSCTFDPVSSQSWAWVVAIMNPDSYVNFTWKVVSNKNVCYSVEIHNESQYEPKQL